MKPPSCAGCPLELTGQGFVPSYGSGKNGILFIGEAPGAREAQVGQPFVGDAGAQLNRTLSFSSIDRYQSRLANVIQCRPPNNWLEHAPWEFGAIGHCQPNLHETVRAMKPKVIVPLGNTALNAILGVKGIEKKRGYVYDWTFEGVTYQVVPTYHPSFLIRGAQNLTGVQLFDLQKAARVARSGYREPAYDYTQHPGERDLDDFVAEANTAALRGDWLAADIETPRSTGLEEDEYGDIIDSEITRISFAFKGGRAITIPWENRFFPGIQRLFLLPFEYFVFWNADFDVPRLQSKGIVIRRVLDAMWMWHFLQSDLPRGLGYVSTFYTDLREWKSLSDSFPEYYSCTDADATIQNAYGIREALRKEGRFDAFIRHYVALQPRVEVMGRSGVLIDPLRQGEFKAEIDKELGEIDNEIQASVPRGLRPFKVRVKIPANAALGQLCRAGSQEQWDYDHETGEWGEVGPFLYNSSKQVIAYIRSKGYVVPKNFKTGKASSGADEIEALAKKNPNDPILPLVLKARELRKVTGQYIDGYAAGPDGRVRTTFTRKPSTWRFAAERPNVQNVLKRGELAKAYRRQFVAAPAHVLVELDYRAVEAVLVGYYAGDPNYIRAAKLGVHAILQSHVMGSPINLSLPEGEIRKLVSAVKKEDPKLYNACKMIVHMSAYGGSARRIRIAHPEYFKTVKEAADLQDIYFSTIAKGVKAWQTRTLNSAYSAHYLQNAYGYRHWFWDVYHNVGKQLEWGTSAKAALAFLPQSTAAGLMSEAISNLPEEVFKYVRWTIHDALLCEIPDDSDLPARIQSIRSVMEAPQEKLGGLSIEVEVTAGKDWGSMEDWK